MESARLRRRLLVAERTASTSLLMKDLERRAAECPMAFALLIPDVCSRNAADWTLGPRSVDTPCGAHDASRSRSFIPLRRETK